MKNKSFGVTFMKTKRSGAEVMFMKRALEPALCHFSDGSAALK